jgi:microcompartment protein CcmL/EutN
VRSVAVFESRGIASLLAILDELVKQGSAQLLTLRLIGGGFAVLAVEADHAALVVTLDRAVARAQKVVGTDVQWRLYPVVQRRSHQTLTGRFGAREIAGPPA